MAVFEAQSKWSKFCGSELEQPVILRGPRKPEAWSPHSEHFSPSYPLGHLMIFNTIELSSPVTLVISRWVWYSWSYNFCTSISGSIGEWHARLKTIAFVVFVEPIMVRDLLSACCSSWNIHHQQQLSILLCPERGSQTVTMMILAASRQLPNLSSMQVFLGLPLTLSL